MQEKFIPFPKDNDWISIAEDFEKMWQYPHCLGSIDVRQFEILKPSHSGTFFYNYKHFFSIGLLVACGAHKRFIFADIGSYGTQLL